MSVIRAFIAISLSAEIHHSLNQVLSSLKSRLVGAPLRWVPASSIHLTLKFLGDVSLSNQQLIVKMLDLEVGHHAPFELSIGELGFFPSINRPRIIWVGVEAPQELFALQHGIDVETSRLGYPSEDRPYSPHLTIGRVSRNVGMNDFRQISDGIGKVKVGFLGALRVQNVDLFKSDLKSEGAVYTRIYRATLGNGLKDSN